MDLTALTPVLETERLRMRGRTMDDFPFFLEMWADPVVARYIDGKPRSEEDTWSKFLRTTGHWALLGFGYWVVEEKESGRLVGEVGFGEFKRAIEPSLKGRPEMGWVLASFAHGKGYATEAAQAAVAWGDDHFASKHMSCIIGVENARSVRVAQKCGFEQVATAHYHGEDIFVFHRN